MEEKLQTPQDGLTPTATVHELSDKIMAVKADYSKTKIFALAIAAGAFVAMGAQCCLTVSTGDSQIGWGVTKLLGAMTFATGLMMVLLTGSELFTGNIMMAFSVLEKKISLMKLLRSWSFVYFGNFIGSLIIALLIFYGGMGSMAGNGLGAVGLQTAFAKLNLSFMEAFCRGILCNWLVCLAVFMAMTSKRVIGKLFAMFFPITIFVASGYEHCVANMFFLPNGIFMKTIPAIVSASGLTPEQIGTITWETFIVNNLIPVTLGNIVGAFVFVVLLFWIAYIREENRK